WELLPGARWLVGFTEDFELCCWDLFAGGTGAMQAVVLGRMDKPADAEFQSTAMDYDQDGQTCVFAVIIGSYQCVEYPSF
ncbi:hypothetical protein FRB90_009705, partial [Tulasnella sp. 427]